MNNDFWLAQEDMKKWSSPEDKLQEECEEQDSSYDDYLYDSLKDYELETK